MREIKFRGKRIDNGEWVHGYYASSPNWGSGIFKIEEKQENKGYFPFSFIKIDPKTLGQFTGLKDKNGVEIYEGDITYNMYTEKKSIIEWFEGGFSCVNDKKAYYIPDYIEIIGNIHENKDLLEDNNGKEE